MKIWSLHELDRDVLRQWAMMESTEDDMYRMPSSVPLMYVLRARREA